MPRYANPFYGQSGMDPSIAMIGQGLARALFGDPEARMEQQLNEARLAQMAASTESERMQGLLRGQTFKARGGGVESAVAGLIPRPPAPSSAPAGMISPPAGAGGDAIEFRPEFEGVAAAIAGALPAETGRPAPQLVPQGMADARTAPSGAAPEAMDPRAIAALAGALSQADQLGEASELVRVIAAMAGDDETVRRGLAAGGSTPGENFALTPERADDIRGQEFDNRIDLERIQSGDRRYNTDADYNASIYNTDVDARTQARGQDIGSSDRRRGQDMRDGVRPVHDAAHIARNLFPGIPINDHRRDPNSNLGRENPNSWHVRSGGAIDTPRLPGMTFQQYVQRYRDAGYEIIEAIDEYANPSPHSTGGHWHLVIGQRGSGTGRQAGRNGRPAAPREVQRADVQTMTSALVEGVGGQAAWQALPSEHRAWLRRNASIQFQSSGNPLTAASFAIQERQRRLQQGGNGGGGRSPLASAVEMTANAAGRVRGAPAPRPASAAQPRVVARFDRNGNRIQ